MSPSWMELIVESGMKSEKQMALLMQEGNELIAIFVASSNTAHKSGNKHTNKSNLKSGYCHEVFAISLCQNRYRGFCPVNAGENHTDQDWQPNLRKLDDTNKSQFEI